jgi:hypothetical protein
MQYYCHSGGCSGADMTWENEGNKWGVITIPYSFQNHVQDSPNPKILTPEELSEGWEHVLIAEQTLKRPTNRIKSTYVRKLLARNWFQVKNSTAIYAVGMFQNKKRTIVDGGTGWAVQMAVDNKKPVFFFDQDNKMWYSYDYQYETFELLFSAQPTLTQHFAGIGTREITSDGINAIKNVYIYNFGRV